MIVGVYHAVAVLNRALEKDPEAITNLVFTRIPCNADLAEDGTIKVSFIRDKRSEVGLLGILNGIFSDGSIEHGPIVATFDNKTQCISSFSSSALKNIDILSDVSE